MDGKCQQFIRGVCGAKIPGFASKDECQRACGPKKASDGGQDYDRWPGPLDPVKEALKAASKFNTKLSTCVTVQLPPVAGHVSDEPLKCGQMPPPPPLKPGEPCNDLAVKIWGFVDGKCQKFNIKPCGYKLIGFVSEDECQKGCEGQDYQAAPWQCEQRPYLCPTSPNCIPPRC